MVTDQSFTHRPDAVSWGGGPDTHAWHSVGGRAGGAPQGRYGPRGPGMMSGGVRAGGQAGPGASGTQEDVETAEGSKERP